MRSVGAERVERWRKEGWDWDYTGNVKYVDVKLLLPMKHATSQAFLTRLGLGMGRRATTQIRRDGRCSSVDGEGGVMGIVVEAAAAD